MIKLEVQRVLTKKSGVDQDVDWETKLTTYVGPTPPVIYLIDKGHKGVIRTMNAAAAA